jgi:hypothetical protein
MTAPTNAARLAVLRLTAEEAVRFPETVTVEQIRELGRFTRTALSSTAADPGQATRAER